MRIIWAEGALSDWEGIARYIAVNFGKKIYDEYDEATDYPIQQARRAPVVHIRASFEKHFRPMGTNNQTSK